MIELLNRRISHIKTVESCLFYSIERAKYEKDVDIRIELDEAIKVLSNEYCKFII